MSQMVFTFPPKEVYDAAAFLPMTCNSTALAGLERLSTQGRGMLFVHGPKGCGKTHFMHVAAARLGLKVWTPETLPANPTSGNCWVIDDIERADADAQARLFHLFNHVQASHGILLVASHVPASGLRMLPDLTSRLQTMPHVVLERLDQAHLQLLLVKLAADRQIELEPAVIRYVLRHADRSPDMLEALLDDLDKTSLERQKPVTIPLVKDVMARFIETELRP